MRVCVCAHNYREHRREGVHVTTLSSNGRGFGHGVRHPPSKSQLVSCMHDQLAIIIIISLPT